MPRGYERCRIAREILSDSSNSSPSARVFSCRLSVLPTRPVLVGSDNRERRKRAKASDGRGQPITENRQREPKASLGRTRAKRAGLCRDGLADRNLEHAERQLVGKL